VAAGYHGDNARTYMSYGNKMGSMSPEDSFISLCCNAELESFSQRMGSRLLGGAPAVRVRALLGAGSHLGIVFSYLNL